MIKLTEGSLKKSILYFSIPLILSNLLQVMFNMADIAVVGRFSGPEALGSVGSTTILVALFNAFIIGAACGYNVKTALYIGSGNESEIRKTVHTSFAISILIGIIIMLTGVFGSEYILTLMHTKNDLIKGAVTYLRIYSLGMPALSLYNYGHAVLSAAGDTKKPLKYLSIAGVLNVFLNIIFVTVFNLSVAGVAIASIISQYLSAFLVLRALFKSDKAYGLTFNRSFIDKRRAGEILRISLPSGLQHSIFQVANLFVQTGVNTFATITVEGNSAATNADALVYDVMAAFYTACASFMGQNLGAGKKDRVKKSFYISLAYSFLSALIIGVLLVVFGRQFLSLFTKDPDVVKEGLKRLTVMGFSYCISAFMDCTIAASRALGESFIPMVIVFLGSCVFRIIWIYTIFVYFHTIESLYLLYAFSWTVTAIAEIIFYKRVVKRVLA